MGCPKGKVGKKQSTVPGRGDGANWAKGSPNSRKRKWSRRGLRKTEERGELAVGKKQPA